MVNISWGKKAKGKKSERTRNVHSEYFRIVIFTPDWIAIICYFLFYLVYEFEEIPNSRPNVLEKYRKSRCIQLKLVCVFT